MIEVRNLSKSFGTQQVLSDISFAVPEGKICGLIGCNGVGKTTLLKILMGIYRPDCGSVLFGGQKVYENPRVKQRCFFLTEEAGAFDRASMCAMQRYYRGFYPNWRGQTFYGLAEWFGLDVQKPVDSFSKGMQRQAALTLTMASGPRYLLLDEAFDGLDDSMRRKVRDMLRFYVREKGAAVIITSHNLQELEDFAEQIGMLDDGRLIFYDTIAHMRENYQTCRFRFDGPEEAVAALEPELLERDGDHWLAVLRRTPQEARETLAAAGISDAAVRPVELEEFFRKAGKTHEADFRKIFG